MIGGARLDEFRFLERRSVTSAADALSVSLDPVPVGKTFTIISYHAFPSQAETRTWQFRRTSQGRFFVLNSPITVTLAIQEPCTSLPPGSDLVLFPGEVLSVRRDAATAGSTITLEALGVFSDMAPTRYIEPQRLIASRRRSGAWPRASDIGETRAAAGGHEGEPGPGFPRDEPM